jgi:hypothetical protein
MKSKHNILALVGKAKNKLRNCELWLIEVLLVKQWGIKPAPPR